MSTFLRLSESVLPSFFSILDIQCIYTAPGKTLHVSVALLTQPMVLKEPMEGFRMLIFAHKVTDYVSRGQNTNHVSRSQNYGI